MSNMQKRPATPVEKYQALVQSMAAASLEDWLGADRAREAAGRLVNTLREAAAKEPKLYTCPPRDVAVAIAMCARTQLMPGGAFPDVYLIPRRISEKDDNGRWQKVLRLNWQISARGLRKLVEREGYRLQGRLVMDGDHFEAAYGLTETLEHRPDWSKAPNWERLTHAYVVATHLSTGRQAFVVLHKAQIQERRNKAQTDTFWEAWPLEMTEKTAMAYAVRRGIVPVEETRAALGVEDSVHVVEAAPAPNVHQLPPPVVHQQAPPAALPVYQVPVEDLFRQPEPEPATVLAQELASGEAILTDPGADAPGAWTPPAAVQEQPQVVEPPKQAPPVGNPTPAEAQEILPADRPKPKGPDPELEALRADVTQLQAKLGPGDLKSVRHAMGFTARSRIGAMGKAKLDAYAVKIRAKLAERAAEEDLG